MHAGEGSYSEDKTTATFLIHVLDLSLQNNTGPVSERKVKAKCILGSQTIANALTGITEDITSKPGHDLCCSKEKAH